jgi:hypothetical protein
VDECREEVDQDKKKQEQAFGENLYQQYLMT